MAERRLLLANGGGGKIIGRFIGGTIEVVCVVAMGEAATLDAGAFGGAGVGSGAVVGGLC